MPSKWTPKIQKEYQTNTQMVIFGSSSNFFSSSFVFSGPNPGTLHFSHFLRIFGIQGFLGSVPGPQDPSASAQGPTQ